MANFPEDNLPSEFDVVVDGTGLIQSIVAAALTRAGKTVLHLDANGYYGDHWASLMHRELQSWMTGDLSTFPEPPVISDKQVLSLTPPADSVTNLIEIIPPHGVAADTTNEQGPPLESAPSEQNEQGPPLESVSNEQGPSSESAPNEQGPPTESVPNEQGPPLESTPDEQGPPTESVSNEQGPPLESTPNEQGPPTESAPNKQGPPTESAPNKQGPPTEGAPNEQGPPTESAPNEPGPPTEGAPNEQGPLESAPNEQGPPLESTPNEQAPPTESAPNKQGPPTNWVSLESQWRRFSFDLIPKVLYCRGGLVDLLTQSNCARYVEFKAVGKIYRVCEGCVEQVPCSRADLFSTQAVSMLEKRRMMKFLSFCADYTSQLDTVQEYAESAFEEFLQSRGLPDKIIDYIAHSIAMVGRKARTLDGLEATKVFLTSLGRFGNAPFLYPVFGVGELGQAFCRMCAVFGGVYCLRRSIAGLVVKDNHVEGVVCTTGQRIKTSTVVCSARRVRDTLNITEHLSEVVVSRAMAVTNGPLPGTDGKVAVVTVPPLSTGPEQTYSVSVLQLDPTSNCSAPGTYLLHLVCVQSGSTAQSDLEPVLRTLLEKEGGPCVLWSLYYNLSLCHVTGPISTQLKGVLVTSDPDTSLNYEQAVREARHLFEGVCPGEEFLPTPPDPRDIVYDTPPPSTEDEQTAGGDQSSAENEADVGKTSSTAEQ